MHSREYQQILGQEDERSSSDPSVDTLYVEPVVLGSQKCKQHQINRSIAKNLVVKCNLPLSIVENHAFRDFMKESNPKWQPVSSKTLKSNLVPMFVSNVEKMIREALAPVREVTLTVDAWSDRRCRSFLGVTAHFVDHNMLPQAHLIDFLRFKSPHTGENIQQITEDVVDRFGLKDKVFRIVTDNASTMIKAYRFGLSVDEEAYQTNDQVRPMLDGSTTVDDDEGE